MGRPGLLGMAARTAVVAGTATAVSGHVARRQNERAQEQYMQQQAEMQQAEIQQQAMAAPAPAQYAAAPPAGDDMVGQLQQLAQLKAQGALSDAEFEAAKARLLG
jgi:hypothetical protein